MRFFHFAARCAAVLLAVAVLVAVIIVGKAIAAGGDVLPALVAIVEPISSAALLVVVCVYFRDDA